MAQIDATDNTAKPMDRAPAQADNFNRTELYNSMSSNTSGGAKGGLDNAGQAPGVSGDHLDFAKAGDIYGKPTQAGMTGSSERAANGKTGDGVKTPEQQMTDSEERVGPRPDGGVPDRVVATAPSLDSGPHSEAKASSKNGKVDDVSMYDAKSNQLIDYQLNPQGDVSSRTTTDMNTNTVDRVNYGADHHAASHTISKDGGPAQDAPVDPKDTAITTLDQNGQVRAIDTSSSNSSGRVTLDANGRPTSTDNMQFSNDGSTSTRQDYNENGRAGDSTTSNYDANGKLQSTERTQGYGTTTDKYDPETGKKVETDFQSPYETDRTLYYGDRTETASKLQNGSASFKVDRNDGSSYSSDYTAQGNLTTTTERQADGSYSQITEDNRFKKTEASDAKSGINATVDEDKYRGTLSKSWNAPGQPQQNWTELRT